MDRGGRCRQQTLYGSVFISRLRSYQLCLVDLQGLTNNLISSDQKEWGAGRGSCMRGRIVQPILSLLSFPPLPLIRLIVPHCGWWRDWERGVGSPIVSLGFVTQTTGSRQGQKKSESHTNYSICFTHTAVITWVNPISVPQLCVLHWANTCQHRWQGKLLPQLD